MPFLCLKALLCIALLVFCCHSFVLACADDQDLVPLSSKVSVSQISLSTRHGYSGGMPMFIITAHTEATMSANFWSDLHQEVDAVLQENIPL